MLIPIATTHWSCPPPRVPHRTPGLTSSKALSLPREVEKLEAEQEGEGAGGAACWEGEEPTRPYGATRSSGTTYSAVTKGTMVVNANAPHL